MGNIVPYNINLSQCKWTTLPYKKAQSRWMDQERKSTHLFPIGNTLKCNGEKTVERAVTLHTTDLKPNG